MLTAPTLPEVVPANDSEEHEKTRAEAHQRVAGLVGLAEAGHYEAAVEQVGNELPA